MPGADFAGERAEIVLAHVLRAEPDVLGFQDRLGHRFQRGERRADHDVHFLHVRQFALEVADQGQRLGDGLVHLPVAGNDQFSFFVHFKIIFRALKLFVRQRRHAGQHRAFQKFQARAAAGAHERHLVAQFGLVQRLHAVAAADDALGAVLLRGVRHGLRDGVGAGGKPLVLEHAHRAVPQNRLCAWQ